MMMIMIIIFIVIVLKMMTMIAVMIVTMHAEISPSPLSQTLFNRRYNILCFHCALVKI